MNICVIPAEYNPFHKGHILHIKKTRAALGEDTAVIAVMSGDFVQRGDFAILDKFSRAKAAVLSGADLVVELPLPFCCASAERFAYGAVYITNSLGIADCISFGCECGDIEIIKAVAKAADFDGIQSDIAEEMKKCGSYARARQNVIASAIGENAKILSNPNDTLAVEYVRALNKLDSKIKPLAVQRTGALHNGRHSGGIASAQYIRELLALGNSSAFSFMPKAQIAEYKTAYMQKQAPILAKTAERAVLAKLRSMREIDFTALPDAGDGIAYRVFSAVRDGKNLDEICRLIHTKSCTLSRARRIIMYAYLGITRDMFETPPLYTQVLAFNKTGQTLLRKINDSADIPVITKPAAANLLPAPAREAFAFSVRARDLARLCMPDISALQGGEGFRRTPFCSDCD